MTARSALRTTAFLVVAMAAMPAIAGTAFSSDCRSGIAVEPGTEAVPGLAVVRNVDGDRSYFHSDLEGCPEAATCRRKSFVVPGDRVIVMDKVDGWACAWFVGKNGFASSGYLRASDLQELESELGVDPRWVGAWEQARRSALDNLVQARLSFAEHEGQLRVSGFATWARWRVPEVEDEQEGYWDANFGELDEALAIDGNLAYFAAEGEYDCAASFRRIGDYLIVRDNGQCGGHNVTFSGVYVRAAATPETPE